MDIPFNPTAQKLFRSFIQFNRAAWHQHPVAGCRPSEIRVLFCVKRGGAAFGTDMKVSEISKHLHVTSPSITQIIKSLEARDLIERNIDPKDRRSVSVRLTGRGEKVTQQAAEALSDSFNGLIAYLGEDESEQLAELLFKASQYYTEKAASPYGSLWNGDSEV